MFGIFQVADIFINRQEKIMQKLTSISNFDIATVHIISFTLEFAFYTITVRKNKQFLVLDEIDKSYCS